MPPGPGVSQGAGAGQGRDAFLALRYEALRGDGKARPYHLALAHERWALLALLEPLAPLLTRKMRQEMDL